MAIAYIHPSSGDTVEREAWRWVALYDDGTKLEQFEVSGGKAVFHQSNEIDDTKLIELHLIHDMLPEIVIAFPKGAQPIHLYRHQRINEEFIDPETGEHLNREWRVKIWCIGFKLDGNYWLAYTDDSGHTVFSNDRELFLDKALPEGVK